MICGIIYNRGDKMITKEFIEETLREIGPVLLKPVYQKNWSKENPTYGYCYIVSEVLHHYVYPNVVPCVINYGGDIGTHWFVKNRDTGEIFDFTQQQFPFSVQHQDGQPKGFMKGKHKTNKGFISKRGYQLACHLGIAKEEQE